MALAFANPAMAEEAAALAPVLETAAPASAAPQKAQAAEAAAGQGFFDLALFKTVTYQSVVVMTDWGIYFAMMDGVTSGGGLFGILNGITSPLLYYAYENFWNACCAEPPGSDGVVPVSAAKAASYRVISTSRSLLLAIALGHAAMPSLGFAAAVAASRTVVYVANDYFWANNADVAAVAFGAPSVP